MHVFLDGFSQMRLMQDQHLVQAFSLQATDEPFANRVGHGSSVGRHQPIDAGAGGDCRKSRPILAVPIIDEVLRRLSPGCGFAQLLSDPDIGWVRRHRVMDEVSRLNLDDYEDVKRPKQEVMDDGEIAGPDLPSVIFQKSGPILAGFRPVLGKIALNCALADSDPELEEFPPNPFGAPQPVLFSHLLDQDNRLLGYSGFSALGLGFSSPIAAEQIPMPAQERLGLDEMKSLLPERCPTRQEDQIEPIANRQLRLLYLPSQDNQLLSQECVFGDQGGPTPSEIGQ